MYANKASALVVVIAKKDSGPNDEFSRTYQFDTGAAWKNLALEATLRNISTHPIGGFDHDKARKELGIPENYDLMEMIAIGKRGKKRFAKRFTRKRISKSKKTIE